MTHFDELEARGTLRRLELAVDDADSTDAGATEQARRRAARLAGGLERQARAIAHDLEEPLPALAYCLHMGGEPFDMVRLDVAALRPPRPRGRETPDSVLPGGPEALGRARGTTELRPGDEEGPDEPATPYVLPAGARRLAAKLRRAAADSERRLREGS